MHIQYNQYVRMHTSACLQQSRAEHAYNRAAVTMHLATTKVFIDDLGSMSLRVDDEVPEILRLLGFR